MRFVRQHRCVPFINFLNQSCPNPGNIKSDAVSTIAPRPGSTSRTDSSFAEKDTSRKYVQSTEPPFDPRNASIALSSQTTPCEYSN